MTPESVRPAAKTAYSKEEAESYDNIRFKDACGRAMHRFEYSHLHEVLRSIDKSSKILEVGCGTGRLLIDARKEGYKVNGLDASPDMLAQLRAKFAENEDLEVLVGEAAKIPKEDQTYDFVYAIRLLNQTESEAYALDTVTEMLRVTKDDGLVLAEFVNKKRPRWGTNKRKTTRLSVAEVRKHAEARGAAYVYTRGAFFTSMQLYRLTPKLLAPIVNIIDRTLSAIFPSLCSRCYVLFRKRSGNV